MLKNKINIIGLWLIQESRRQCLREGKEYSFGMLEEMANSARSLICFIDPDAPQFVAAGNIPERIREFCKHTNQLIPQTIGEMIRCINESLALKYRNVLEQLIECTGKTYNTIHMVGGGTQSKLLCQLTANACQREVKAGPVEATVLGNILLQLIASGDVKDLAEGRNIIRNSQELVSFSPQEAPGWDDAYQKFKKLIVC